MREVGRDRRSRCYSASWRSQSVVVEVKGILFDADGGGGGKCSL